MSDENLKRLIREVSREVSNESIEDYRGKLKKEFYNWLAVIIIANVAVVSGALGYIMYQYPHNLYKKGENALEPLKTAIADEIGRLDKKEREGRDAREELLTDAKSPEGTLNNIIQNVAREACPSSSDYTALTNRIAAATSSVEANATSTLQYKIRSQGDAEQIKLLLQSASTRYEQFRKSTKGDDLARIRDFIEKNPHLKKIGILASDLSKLEKKQAQDISGLSNRIGSDIQSIRGSIGKGSQSAYRSYGKGKHVNKDKTVTCPAGQYAAGLTVTYGGTCLKKCDGDGGIIQNITVHCKSIF